MSELDAEMLSDFLVEAFEQVEVLDQELVRLEADPDNREVLDVVFRVMHTLKGGAGFLGLQKLEGIAHHAETILARVRDEGMTVTAERVDLLLESADAVRVIVHSLDSQQDEGPNGWDDLIERLEEAVHSGPEGDAETDPESAETEEPVNSEMEALRVFQEELMAAMDRPVKATPKSPEPEVSKEKPAAPSGNGAAGQVRVRVDLLDKLMNLVGELVLSRNQILQIAGGLEDGHLSSACQRINLVTSELQEHIMQTRMQPVGTILKRFPRLVRDLAAQTGKDVRLLLEGQDTGLDRTVVEAIKDPLTHILRNSIDHGIELPEDRRRAGKPPQGTIHIRAYHEGGQVTIEFSDDGRGVDTEKVRKRALERGLIDSQQAERMSERDVLQLLFEPGFSTASEVTNLSGRGVGMDVVRTSTEKIGGTMDLQSVEGRGTIVKLRIPLTLAIIPALVVEAGGERYAIPQVNLQELVRLESSESLDYLYEAEVYRLRGQLLPLLRLREVLGLEPKDEEREVNIVVLSFDSLTFGLIVDGICDTEEIVVKPLSSELKRLMVYAGATIMGDGRVSLILDVGGLARATNLRVEEQQKKERERSLRTSEPDSQAILLFTLGDQQRFGIPLSLVSRLEEFERAQIEHLSNQMVIQYRGHLLPLYELSRELGCGGGLDSESLFVLVFESGGNRLGLVVDRILDVVEERLMVESSSDNFGPVLGSAVVAGKAVSIIDTEAVIRRLQPHWFEGATERPQLGGHRVLMVAGNSFRSCLVKSHLQTGGFQLIQTEDFEVALSREQLNDGAFDCLLVDPEQPAFASYRKRLLELRERLPIVTLTPTEETSWGAISDLGRSQLLAQLQKICKGAAA